MGKYSITQWADMHVRLMITMDVEADSIDEACEAVTDKIYDENRTALEPTGAYIDDVDWYDEEIKELEEVDYEDISM